jgi:anti-sigma factor RsiW
MMSPHLAERTLQEAAESVDLLPASQLAHLHSCPLCQGRVATYQQLLTAAAHLLPPPFPLDFTASVLAQLPRAEPAFPWALRVVAVLVLGVVVVFLSLFGALLVPAFQSLATDLAGGLVTAGGILVAGRCLALLVRHRRQMRQLAFS